MSDTTAATDYKVGQKIIHWLMSFFIILDLAVAQKFGDVLEEADRLQSRMDHSTLGTTLAVLLLLRLYFRIRHGVPTLPETMANWQQKAARLTHILLYVAMVCLLSTGVLTALQATDPILIYNSIEVTLGNMDEETFKFMRQFHEIMTWTMMGLIGLHIVAALYHQFILKDRILVKMLRLWTSEKADAAA
jgi:cytochrome b561